MLFLSGKIVRADIMKMDDGRSKGCGTVTFETTAEASRAVSIFSIFYSTIQIPFDYLHNSVSF